MTKTLTIAVVSAGLSNPSSTALLADQLTEETQRQLATADAQVQVERIELRELGNAIMQYFLTGIPTPALEQAHAVIARAHGIITVTQIFKASYSGLFKSFWDTINEGTLEGKAILPAATGGTARHSLALDNAIRPLLSYMKGIVIPSGLFAATDDFGADNALPKRIRLSVGEFVNLLTALTGVQSHAAHTQATQDSMYSTGAATSASDAPGVPGSHMHGALVGKDASYDEAGGANSGSFFGIAKGATVDTGTEDGPHHLTVTPFEQLLRET
ncbi:MAG: NAD(P)H-dependent oxidoreductase [Rothia sp. (in: high G+C Gram-positive bacteria)]|uniref:CE1759 family FMN reductase n=1 Tax=Rothia sp. (in: high G+C Gram-positive bacteria) TaxID=1885016 RepID=UPI0026DD736E|nr:CE1759 family FMN reductase [Rothia sp. (in: high G+C Gram-positive bacteria)]MDO4884903.1 NAD(P)H-dependent oxidoreductase [Rothia sp. (in: high G+C Gram-positive bacteria)]